MKVLLLSPKPALLLQSLSADQVDISHENLCPTQIGLEGYDFAISFGYRFILSRECIDSLRGNILNIHISLLPWNKGSDPNIWSWLENTPKGVSIHWVTDQVDAGDIAIQQEVALNEFSSLRETYQVLQETAVKLFDRFWNEIGVANSNRSPQLGSGSRHKKSDLKKHATALAKGYETRCIDLLRYGQENGLWLESQ